MSPTSPPASQVAHVVVGTAGHIDHGKSSLVRRLTGIDPDRLPEEKARGITIDLGYAGRTLDDGRILGFIDVPGHERFIRNMVAGATGIDIALLVVAADDGVMPQTLEHLQILELLGIEHLLVALTKIDMVDEVLRELAAEDVRSVLSATRYRDAPIVPCSSVTGEGCENVWQTLVDLLAAVRERSASGIFRMPVQRSFSVKGFGTVLTGVPVTGRVALGETLEVLPGGKRGKVRGIEAYERSLDQATAGHRTAINLADVEVTDVGRGKVVAHPGILRASSHIAGELSVLAGLDEPVEDGLEVRFLTGTAEIVGELALLAGTPIPPGGRGFVQIVLAEPVAALPGDRFILRRQSPMRTLGGGVALRLDERRLKRRREWILADLQARRSAVRSVERFADYLLAQVDGAMTAADLAREAGVTLAEAESVFAVRQAAGLAVAVMPGRFTSRAALDELSRRSLKEVTALHQRDPLRHAFEIPQVARLLECDETLLAFVLDELARAGKVQVAQGQVRSSAAPSAPAEVVAERGRIEAVLAERGFDAPRPTTLATELGVPLPRVNEHLRFLAASKAIVKIGEDAYLHAQVVERTLGILKSAIAATGEIDTNAFKTQLGVSRKLLIPLLEHFDAIGVTRRDGNRRFLREART